MSPRDDPDLGGRRRLLRGDLLTFHHVVDNVGAGLATIIGNLQVVVVGSSRGSSGASGRRRNVIVALPIVLVGVVLISGAVGW